MKTDGAAILGIVRNKCGYRVGRTVDPPGRAGGNLEAWSTVGHLFQWKKCGRRLFSSDGSGLAAGTCHLTRYRVDIAMSLLDVIPVLVGVTPFGATINIRTGIELRSVMTIDALRLSI
jgi:hypothetical protein